MEHIDSRRTYYYVFAALVFLTGATTAVAYVDLGVFNVVVAMSIAVVKMLLVALFFMHLRYSNALLKVVVLGGVLWLAILVAMTLGDFFSRGWLPVPGK